jgi:uncharacterized protein YjiS (DUF1127 family)
MRDYVLHQAEFHDSTFAFPRLRRLLRSWLAKQQLRQLARLDDYMLHDIGLTRDELRHGLKLPYDVDPVAALVQSRDIRVARGRRHR